MCHVNERIFVQKLADTVGVEISFLLHKDADAKVEVNHGWEADIDAVVGNASRAVGR